ncbi:MAG: NAD-dependent epimerase/dehydratase family protein [Anaerolineae bacterium]|jgi:hypothetical protein|nr:NAD-dependent epimerase/dehydratase family protein [Anaerolineae bacterium]MBT7990571.1 NAD-dependent epimerase/dehydratase family protein [Anaerolineae bacterium]
MKKIIILGGYGTYGKLISENLSRTNANITIIGRNAIKGEKFAKEIGVNFAQCDVSDEDALRKIISSAFLVINASGPYLAGDYSIPQTAIEMGCHYIDLGDGREYVAKITTLHKRAQEKGVFICVGASTSPAITSAMVQELKKETQSIRSIKIALNAGNKNQAGVSTFKSILEYVGKEIPVWQNGKWKHLLGWEKAEFINFPAPVGKRRVQLCDVPDLALFPKLFNARNVIFKAGVEITFFNYALSSLAKLKEIFPTIDLPALARPLVRLSGLFKAFGTFHGGLAVLLKDVHGKEKSLYLLAPQDGPQIPAAPAILVARKILSGRIQQKGAYPCIGFIKFDEYKEHLSQFGIETIEN